MEVYKTHNFTVVVNFIYIYFHLMPLNWYCFASINFTREKDVIVLQCHTFALCYFWTREMNLQLVMLMLEVAEESCVEEIKDKWKMHLEIEHQLFICL